MTSLLRTEHVMIQSRLLECPSLAKHQHEACLILKGTLQYHCSADWYLETSEPNHRFIRGNMWWREADCIQVLTPCCECIHLPIFDLRFVIFLLKGHDCPEWVFGRPFWDPFEMVSVFSEETSVKSYIQHRKLKCFKKADELIKEAALLYICGDASRMARDDCKQRSRRF